VLLIALRSLSTPLPVSLCSIEFRLPRSIRTVAADRSASRLSGASSALRRRAASLPGVPLARLPASVGMTMDVAVAIGVDVVRPTGRRRSGAPGQRRARRRVAGAIG
jgi:hypothetical protein